MSLKAKLQLHMKLHKGGSVYVWEATDYPGLQICDRRETSKDPVVRTITYKDQEYKTIADAVEAAKAAAPVLQPGLVCAGCNKPTTLFKPICDDCLP